MKKQSMKDRRDESRGMRDRSGYPSESDFEGRDIRLSDNMHASPVAHLPSTDAEYYDMDRIEHYTDGTQGYNREAFNYDY